MKTSQWALRGLPLVLMAMIGLALWMNGNRREQTPPVPAVCGDLVKGCALSGEGRFRVGVDQAIKPLKPFQLWVDAPGATSAEASFTMEDMDMGFNIYRLRADREGVFRITATLPVCVSGQRKWIMTLTIDGQRWNVPFVTEL